MGNLTFKDLMNSGAVLNCIGASGGYDLTSVWEVFFPEDEVTILTSFWIGDKSYRYAESLNEILNGTVSLTDEVLLLSKEMKKETSVFEQIDYISENEIFKETEIWNFETLALAKVEAIEFLKEKFKK